MRSKRPSAQILTTCAVLAMGMALLVTNGLLDVVLTVAMVAMVAALAGLYRLRPDTRPALLYNRRPAPDTAAGIRYGQPTRPAP